MKVHGLALGTGQGCLVGHVHARGTLVVASAFRRGGGRRGSTPKQRQSSAGGNGTGRRKPKSASSSSRRTSGERKSREKKSGFSLNGTTETKDLQSLLEESCDEVDTVYDDQYGPDIDCTVETVLSGFRFPLDPFQEEAFRHILCGRSVVVCAPTGAGKTAIAEAAATYFLNQGGKVIYTTPLKALSNQKMMEMRDRFGVEEAGLQTGDASINPDGSVVVMTTEILRNILYRVEEEEEEEKGEGEGVGEGEENETMSLEKKIAMNSGQPRNRLEGVKLVVFDECHYLGDPGRGSVWEEAIINLPPDVLVLAMSATVKNPTDISGWISEVHGTCATVLTTFRPVPLKWHYCLRPGKDDVAMLPLLDDTQTGLNPQLIPPSSRVESFAESLSSFESDDDLSWGGPSTWGRWDSLGDEDLAARRGKGRTAFKNIGSVKSKTLDELINVIENTEPWHKLHKRERVPSIESTVAELDSKSLLPAIWFIFSRKDCDAAVKKIYKSGLHLTSDEEKGIIMRMIQGLRESQPEAVKESSVPALVAGVAAHHAGCLPGWKLLIERLFQQGLLKVVFATETLAAGINMPARTTLLTSLSKRRDDGISLLRHNELMQMAGRAGRRGYDTQGHCVIVQSRWDNPDAAWTILKKGPESLESKFATNYGMVLNLLRTRTMGEAKEFLNRSFSMYLSGSFAKKKLREIQRLERQATQVLENAGIHGEQSSEDSDGQDSVIQKFEKLQGSRREEKRAAKLLRHQLSDERGYTAETMLSEQGIPCVIGIDLSGSSITEEYFLPALLVGKVDDYGSIVRDVPSNSQSFDNKYLCIGADNNMYIIFPPNISAIGQMNEIQKEQTSAAADEVVQRALTLSHKAWSRLAKGVMRAEGSSLTASYIPTCIPQASKLDRIFPSAEGLSALEEQKERIQRLKHEMELLRGDTEMAKNSRKRSQAFAKAGSIMDRAMAMREDLESQVGGSWRDFQNIIRVLEGYGAIVDPSVKEDSLASIHESPPNDDLRYEFTPLGLVSRELRGSNELWMALALTHASLQTLAAPQLAAVFSSLVAEDSISRIQTIGSAYPPSSAVIQAIEELEGLREELSVTQLEAGINFPTSLDHTLAGVVEAWASGLGWNEVTGDCDLDDGDVARLLMRTVDTLRQAAFCEHLLPPLRSAAKTAARKMNRPPISDLIA